MTAELLGICLCIPSKGGVVDADKKNLVEDLPSQMEKTNGCKVM